MKSMDQLYLSENMSDVTLFVGQSKEEGYRFPAHKFVLMVSSQVWKRLLTSNMEESDTNEILIKDVEPHIFEHLLQYLYCHTLKISSIEECLEVLQAADKYFLKELIEACSQEFFKHRITLDNFWTLYYNIHFYPELIPPRVILNAMQFLYNNAPSLFLREKFKLLPQPALLKIIQHNELRIFENLVFDCLMGWAKIQCLKQKLEYNPQNLRKVLGDIFYHLRLLTMTVEQLQSGPIASGILSTEEVTLLIKGVNEKVSNLPPPWDNNRLKTPRCQNQQSWSKVYSHAVKSQIEVAKDCHSMLLMFTKETVLESIIAVNKTAGYIEAVLKDLNGLIIQKWNFYSAANKSNSLAGCFYLKAYTCYEFEIKGANIQCYKADCWGSFLNEVVFFCCRKCELEMIDSYKQVKYVKFLFDKLRMENNVIAQVPFLFNGIVASFC